MKGCDMMPFIVTPSRISPNKTPQHLLLHEDKQPYISHDLLFKELIQTYFEQFIDLFFPEIHTNIDFSTVKFLTGELIPDALKRRKKIVDILVEVKWKETDTLILIHVEPQSYKQKDFTERMFHYYSFLYGYYRQPIIPIAILTFKEQPNDQQYVITFNDLEIMKFEYFTLHLASLNWRSFIRKPNPVAAALLGKMGYTKSEKVRIKVEFFRMMNDLKIDKDKSRFLLQFLEVYMPLSETEEDEVMAELKRETENFDIASLPISYEERGKKIGREEGKEENKLEIAVKMLKKDMPIDLIIEFTELTKEKILELKKNL